MKKVYTKNAPEAIGPYSQAQIIEQSSALGLVFLSGQIPINPATSIIEATEIEEQTKQVCENIKAVLSAAGSSLEKVVKTTCFLVDMADFAKFNSVYKDYFVSLPARSCVAVKQLPKNALVEIEVIAEK